jgi:hypothetical protein
MSEGELTIYASTPAQGLFFEVLDPERLET